MKKLLSLSQDYTLEVKFKPNYKEGNPDFIDETKTKVNGKNNVDNISMMLEIPGMDGYYNGFYRKIYLSKEDIQTLFLRISEIESAPQQQELNGDEDLPF